MAKIPRHIKDIIYGEINSHNKENVCDHFERIGGGFSRFKGTDIEINQYCYVIPEIYIHSEDLLKITIEDAKILNSYFGEFSYKLEVHFKQKTARAHGIILDEPGHWYYARSIIRNMIEGKGLKPLYYVIDGSSEDMIYSDIRISCGVNLFIVSLTDHNNIPLIDTKWEGYIKIYPAVAEVVYELKELFDSYDSQSKPASVEYKSDIDTFSWIVKTFVKRRQYSRIKSARN